jgi:hypothetical protein
MPWWCPPVRRLTTYLLNHRLFLPDHTMEFMSATPPQHLVPYFGVEGPYLVSIGLVIYKLSATVTRSATKLD